MKSVLSHIVQKQFSGEYENIATEALAYIVQTNDRARGGLLKMLRGVKPDLPNLSFQTQQSEDNKRPDMWGLDSVKPCVFIENKFWAGFTENQPVEYIKLLATHHSDGLLLMVVPASRQESSWREMLKRLDEADIDWEEYKASADIPRVVKTETGPLMALTTWPKLLQSIDDELSDEPQARNDLIQLKALCETAESDAFIPLSAAELTNQRLPAMLIQLVNVIKRVHEIGLTEGFFSSQGVAAASTYERVGRYVKFPLSSGVSAWLGLPFILWQKHGGTPLWLMFSDSVWCRAPEVKAIIESWAESEGIFTSDELNSFNVAINVPAGEDFDYVVRNILQQLKKISDRLKELPPAQEIGN
jgi:hypothetical protein